MTREDLAFVAEALIELCDKDAGAPCYSEHAFRVRLERSRRRDPQNAHVVMGRHTDVLLQKECKDVCRNAALTDRQNEVFFKRLEGWTFEEIGRSQGHTKQGAHRIFLQALKKLVGAFHVYPYAGMSDVYRGEVRRRARPSRFGTILR